MWEESKFIDCTSSGYFKQFWLNFFVFPKNHSFYLRNCYDKLMVNIQNNEIYLLSVFPRTGRSIFIIDEMNDRKGDL
jgi:hypothetical protein